MRRTAPREEAKLASCEPNANTARPAILLVVAQPQRRRTQQHRKFAPRMAKGKPVSCSLKPAKLVALLGLVLVLSGIGFGYLAFDAGVRAASGSSGGWQDAMLAATGTQQMVSATICVSIGARRRSAQAAARACPPRRALTPHARAVLPAGILVWAISVNQPIDDEY